MLECALVSQTLVHHKTTFFLSLLNLVYAMIVYNIMLCSRFDQTGFVVIAALGKIGAHVFYKEITMKTRLACCIKVIQVFCNINVHVHVHFFSEKYEPTYC